MCGEHVNCKIHMMPYHILKQNFEVVDFNRTENNDQFGRKFLNPSCTNNLVHAVLAESESIYNIKQ